MHATGNVDVNGNLLHHPNAGIITGTTAATGVGIGPMGLNNAANAHSLYSNHNSPAMMTLNSNFTGANHSAVPFTYLSSSTAAAAAQPGNAMHSAVMPIT